MTFGWGFLIGTLIVITGLLTAHYSSHKFLECVGTAMIIGTFLMSACIWFEDEWIPESTESATGNLFWNGGMWGSGLMIALYLAVVIPTYQHFHNPENDVQVIGYLQNAVLVRSCKIEEGIGPANVHFRFCDMIRFEFKKPGKYAVSFPDNPNLNFTHETIATPEEEMAVQIPYGQSVTVMIAANDQNDSHTLDKFPLVKRPGGEEVGSGL